MTLIDPNPVASIKFECEICNKPLYFASTISDGFSGDPEDYEGKHIVELRCPKHGQSWKKFCYNCHLEWKCDEKHLHAKKRSGIKITVLREKHLPVKKEEEPCNKWKKRKQFYAKPSCTYCFFVEEKNECIGEGGSYLYHGSFCTNKKSEFHGKKISYNATTCNKWKSKYTVPARISMSWKKWKKRMEWKLRWNQEISRRFKNRSRGQYIDEITTCRECKHGANVDNEWTFQCRCNKSPNHGKKMENDYTCNWFKASYYRINEWLIWANYKITGTVPWHFLNWKDFIKKMKERKKQRARRK
jgi:hypothetical protein